jgi:hypothetical protein
MAAGERGGSTWEPKRGAWLIPSTIARVPADISELFEGRSPKVLPGIIGFSLFSWGLLTLIAAPLSSAPG